MSSQVQHSATRSGYFSLPAKLCFVLTLSLLYFLIISIITLMNTITSATEDESLNTLHAKGLNAIVKGFNVFFGFTCLVTIIRLSYLIGNYILSIADLRVRAHYNFILFIFSFTIICLVPMLYMLCVHYLYKYNAPSYIRKNLIIQFFFTFLAINTYVVFVQAIFLLLTSMMCTLRSYHTFRYLIKLREIQLNPFARPSHIDHMYETRSMISTTRIVGRKPGCGVYGIPPGLLLAQNKHTPAMRSKMQLLQHPDLY